MSARGRAEVVIAGADAAGLEAALALREFVGDHVRIVMVGASPTLTHRPWAGEEPFGRRSAVDLDAIAADLRLELRSAAVVGVDADSGILRTDQGQLGYDALVLALGPRAVDAVPGATTFAGTGDADALNALLGHVTLTAGARVAFVVPPTTAWTLPAYELALVTSAWAERRGAELEAVVVTSETAPLEAFGPDVSAHTRIELARHQVELLSGSVPEGYDDGLLRLPGPRWVRADAAVALPGLAGPGVFGLPTDERGFVAVDELCRVPGTVNVHAVGDMTGHAPGLGDGAAQQADIAAAVIANGLGVAVPIEPYVAEPLAWPPGAVGGRFLTPYLEAHAHLLDAAGATG